MKRGIFQYKNKVTHDMTHRPKLLIILIIAALAMTAIGVIAAPNWIARSQALALLFVLGVASVYALSSGKEPQSGMWGGPRA